jgi:hypothetical protein
VGTPVTVKRTPGRLTAEEARQPITGCTCGKCGRTDAVIYPWEERGVFVCFSCSPAYLIRYMRDLAEARGVVPA